MLAYAQDGEEAADSSGNTSVDDEASVNTEELKDSSLDEEDAVPSS